MNRSAYGRRALYPAWALVLALTLTGCAFGPHALERTHGKYNEAVRQVSEEELLRNLVHMRYNETPLDLNVTSIAAQYELAGQAEARPFFESPNPSGSTFKHFAALLPDLLVSGANRPTISFVPADDSEAIREFLAPIKVETLAFLTQSNWPVSTILRLWVERLNGVPNAVTASGPSLDGVSDFARYRRIVELMQDIQDRGLATVIAEDRDVPASGPLPASAITAAALVEAAKAGLQYTQQANGQTWVLARKEHRLLIKVNPVGAGSPELAEAETLLNLVPGLPQYDIVVAAGVPDPVPNHTPASTELRVLTRSTAQVYFYLAHGIEVPQEHICADVVRPRTAEDVALTQGLFEVHVCQGHKPPPMAFVAVKYRDYWFYIDDRDRSTKATFMLMLELSRLDFVRRRASTGPVLTLPAGR